MTLNRKFLSKLNLKRTVKLLIKNSCHFSPDIIEKNKPRVYRGVSGWNNYSIPVNRKNDGGVFINGFAPRGALRPTISHDSIVEHIGNSFSNYESFGMHPSIARFFSKASFSLVPSIEKTYLYPSYVYQTNFPRFHVFPADSVPLLAQKHPSGHELIKAACTEGEISGYGNMPAYDVAKARRVESLFTSTLAAHFTAFPFVDPITWLGYFSAGLTIGLYVGKYYAGPVYENPVFKSRDFSFRCPSMSEREYEMYVQHDQNLPNGFQALSYPIAIKLDDVLVEMEKAFANRPNLYDYHLVIDCMVKDDSKDHAATIAIIQEVYYTMRQAQVEAPFIVIKLSDVISQALEAEQSCNQLFSFFKTPEKRTPIIEEIPDVEPVIKPKK